MGDGIRGIFKDNTTTDCDVNLLLFGETGGGKSTFINSISNYFNYPNFNKAQQGKIDVPIPMSINMSEGDEVHGTPNDNEMHNNVEFSTQEVKVYLFPTKMDGKTFNLRLIDTPGVGDPRGVEHDDVNLENILAYLATLQKLHGICFVLKSNQTRLTKFFVYCLKQILTRLDKSASENIIFITTYSKTTRYSARETKHHCLIPLVKDIQSRPPHVNIPLTNDNTFALDNETMTALLEIKEGITFSKYEMEGLEQSWKVSSNEIRRLLKYIIGDFKKGALKPHDVGNTISINEVRFLIEQLSTPIAKVSELIQDNIRLLDRHKERFNLETQTVDQLKTQLYIPCVDLEVKELVQPVTVCTDTKCADVVKVNNVTQWHYKQRCHNPCYLPGIPKEMIGDPGLISCAAMSHGKCTLCGCPWQIHMHIYKETKKINVHKEDQSVKNAIKNKEEIRVHIEKLMKDLNKRRSELEGESQTISRSIAKFSYFLQEHALTPFNDAYSDYLNQLIRNEKHLGKDADQDVIDKLEKLLAQHLALQKTFQESSQNFQKEGTNSDLTPAGIKKSLTELYNLKHIGRTIQELKQKSSSCRHGETQKNFSCVVSTAIDLDQKTAKEKREKSSRDEKPIRKNRSSKKSNRAKKNSSPQSTDSEESYDSSTDKKSSRKGEHSKHEDNPDSDDSTKKGVNRSKNQKEPKSTKSSKTDSNVSKSEQETRARNDKSSRSGRKKHAGRKSSPVGQRCESDDEHPSKSSKKERSTKEKGPKNQKKPKSEDENCDSDDKRSIRSSSDHEARNGASLNETSFKEDEIHKHHKSDDERPKKSNGAKKNSSSQSTDSETSYDSSTEKKSSRLHRRRSQSDDSDDRNSVKSSQKGKHEDNSDSDESTKNSDNRSKNQKEPKSTKSSKTDSNVSKSRKEPSTKETSSKNQKPKSEDESCDLDDKHLVRSSSDLETKNGPSLDETSFEMLCSTL